MGRSWIKTKMEVLLVFRQIKDGKSSASSRFSLHGSTATKGAAKMNIPDVDAIDVFMFEGSTYLATLSSGRCSVHFKLVTGSIETTENGSEMVLGEAGFLLMVSQKQLEFTQ